MARVNKFASVNLNDLFGKKEPAVKTAVNASGSGARPKGDSHGMLVLTRPVKQPIKIGSQSTGNVKATSESLKPTSTDISGLPDTTQIESANEGLVKDNPKPASSTDKPDVYVPPNLRGLHSTSVLFASVKLEPASVEKTSVLSGEEFPSLQASLTPANTNGQQQQTKDNQLDSKEQLEKLQHLSLQAQSRSCLDDITEPGLNHFEPQRPQFFRPSHLRGNEQTTSEKPKTVAEKPDGYLSGNPHLLGNDERENNFGNKPSNTNVMKTTGSGSYKHQIYRREGLTKESPNNDLIWPPELAQPNCGVIQREEQARTEILCGNESMYSPPFKGGSYEREEFPRPGSGESRYYESETFPQPGSSECRYYEREIFLQPGLGGSRYHEKEAFSQPGSGGSKYREKEAFSQLGSGGSKYYEKEAFSRPGSGGSRYEREALPHPWSGGSRYEREALPRPGSGRSRCNEEVFTRPGSGGSRYEREAFIRPGLGGNRYEREALCRPGSRESRYEREVLPRPGTGGSRYERETFPQPCSDGSRFHQEGLTCSGSGGSRYVREGVPRPRSSETRYEREGLPHSGLYGTRFNQDASPHPISGGSQSEREVLPRPGSGSSRFNQEAVPRPVSGGSRYEREALPPSNSSVTSYERGEFPQPGSGVGGCEPEVLPQSASGGSKFEKETLGHPSSVGGMHEREAFCISGYVPCSIEYNNERKVISEAASGGGNCASPVSGGSGYGREEVILPESMDVYCTQPGFKGGGDHVQPNSGDLSYERKVVLRPGSRDNKYLQLSRPSMGGNDRIDGREPYRDSPNGRQNYQRQEANPLMDFADEQNGNIHNAYESNRERGPFKRGVTSRKFPNRNNYCGRGQASVGSYGRDGASVSEKW